MQLANVAHKESADEPFWHVQLAIIVAIVLQLAISDKLVFSSKYLIIGLEVGLLILVSLQALSAPLKRVFALGLVGVVSLANISSLALVIHQLLFNGKVNPHQLLASAVAIYITSIILFGIFYWELDSSRPDEPDFMFPQISSSDNKNWQPSFVDYLYVSVTCATAFSPTDTMPLTHRAKMLMTLHAILALTTVALVAARAVNILG